MDRLLGVVWGAFHEGQSAGALADMRHWLYLGVAVAHLHSLLDRALGVEGAPLLPWRRFLPVHHLLVVQAVVDLGLLGVLLIVLLLLLLFVALGCILLVVLLLLVIDLFLLIRHHAVLVLVDGLSPLEDHLVYVRLDLRGQEVG